MVSFFQLPALKKTPNTFTLQIELQSENMLLWPPRFPKRWKINLISNFHDYLISAGRIGSKIFHINSSTWLQSLLCASTNLFTLKKIFGIRLFFLSWRYPNFQFLFLYGRNWKLWYLHLNTIQYNFFFRLLMSSYKNYIKLFSVRGGTIHTVQNIKYTLTFFTRKNSKLFSVINKHWPRPYWNTSENISEHNTFGINHWF